MHNFALIGVAGFVAPRHLKAIRDTGNNLLAAVDPHDSVGVLDSHFPKAKYFSEIERFDRYMEKMRRRSDTERVHYVSVCSPNYLHDAHVRLALRVRAHAICEKPLVISPWNLDQLAELEAETGCRVYGVLQLRLHPTLVALKQQFDNQASRSRADVQLTYVTRRGPWYHVSWKGLPDKSGELPMNIGIHFFDLLTWVFGPLQESEVHLAERTRWSGVLELEWARVRWFLSVDGEDLPQSAQASGLSAFRSLTVDGEDVDFTRGCSDLHTKVYEEVLAGRGMGIEEARPAIALVHRLRMSKTVDPRRERAHPLVGR